MQQIDVVEQKKKWLLTAILNPNNFIQYHLALEGKNLKYREIKLYGVLKSILNLEGWEYVGYADDYLCQFLSCTPTTANKSLNKLEKAGLILIQNKGNRNRRIYLGAQKAIVEKQQAEANSNDQTKAFQELAKEIKELRKQLDAAQKENQKLKKALIQTKDQSGYMQVEPTEPIYYLHTKGYLTSDDLKDGIKMARLNKTIDDLQLNNHEVKRRMDYILTNIKTKIADPIGYMVTSLQNNADYLNKHSKKELQDLLDYYGVLSKEEGKEMPSNSDQTLINTSGASIYDEFKEYLSNQDQSIESQRTPQNTKTDDKTDYFNQYFGDDPRFKKE